MQPCQTFDGLVKAGYGTAIGTVPLLLMKRQELWLPGFITASSNLLAS
jgi:hypothetical protein